VLSRACKLRKKAFKIMMDPQHFAGNTLWGMENETDISGHQSQRQLEIEMDAPV